jgi:hypothetical protein
MIKLQHQSKSIKNISLYDVGSLSNTPSLSIADAVINLSAMNRQR